MPKYLCHIALLTFSFQLLAFSLQAQQLKLGNNPTQINKAAVLELQSKNQGLRLTRVDTGDVNIIINSLPTQAEKDSTNGMIVFQTKDSSIYYRTGGVWRKLVMKDSLGIISLDTLTNKYQYFELKLGEGPSGFSSDPVTGVHTLKIDGASTGVVGVVTEGKQTWDGPKIFKRSITLDTLHPGSVVFIGGPLGGEADTLSENNDSLYWDNTTGKLYTSGLTFTNLNSSTTPSTGGAIGVDGAGNVVRIKGLDGLILGNTPGTDAASASGQGLNIDSTSSQDTTILNIPNASGTVRGVVTTDEQDFEGKKRLLKSPVIKPLTPGSVIFMGSDTTLSENNDKFYWDDANKRLGIGTNNPDNTLEVNAPGKSGIRLTHLPGTSIDASAAAIGVNSSGDVVRVNNTPTYYDSSGTVLSPQVQKILIDSITGNSVAEIRSINISAIGFTKVLNIQLTARIVPNNEGVYGIVADVVDYNTSTVRIRILELQYWNTGGLLGLGNLTAGGRIIPPSTQASLLGALGAPTTLDPKPYTVYYKIEGY